ncbi:hypothetical protein [Thioflexithrix psekupsensis]|uniref:Uncharacterized protein n=1 Tax=Thioflexithrix psekupsensis TaxID=1570016 RepID=A0A251X7L9_9GAMM|nr:hypothetical protein [Thioflexithrix psekupsensis]OUD14059.1 hypothetical protein TPSD3_06895 [Thioflexithrix psekupsensis]
MDEEQFRQTQAALIERSCPFVKGILTQRCHCRQAKKLFIAERETVYCQNLMAQQQCEMFFSQLNEKARFALKIIEVNQPMPHAKKMKLVCGGLFALQELLSPELESVKIVLDIHELISKTLRHYGDLAQLPWPELVRAIGEYQVRHSSRNKE